MRLKGREVFFITVFVNVNVCINLFIVFIR